MKELYELQEEIKYLEKCIQELYEDLLRAVRGHYIYSCGTIVNWIKEKEKSLEELESEYNDKVA